MSERKEIRQSKINPHSNNKTVDSTRKNTTAKKTGEQFKSHRKNLMVEFDKGQISTVQKEPREEEAQENLNSMNSSSLSSIQIIEATRRSNNLGTDDYSFQLPKSYILAMTGLQEVVTQRDAEIYRLKQLFDEERQKAYSLSNELRELIAQSKQSQSLLAELKTEVKLLKETSLE